MEKITQKQQVIEVLRQAGGYATLRRLNEEHGEEGYQRDISAYYLQTQPRQ